MSELTPNEIADYPLRTGVRGYRVEQVDELLDRVADRIETLERELAETQERVQVAERRAEESEATEGTLKRTLVTAQRAAEETVAEARSEAATVRAEAQEQADAMLGDARSEGEDLRVRAAEELQAAEAEAAGIREDAVREVARLRDAAERFRAQMREHLDAHTALLARAPQAQQLPEVAPTRSDEPGGEEDEGDGGGSGGDAVAPEEGSALFASNTHPTESGDSGGDSSS